MTLPIMTALPGERRGYVDGPDGQIHYRDIGKGPVVLLIHQAPWSSIQFRHVMPLLARAGFRALAADLPGHGMSDPPAQPGIESYAESMAVLLGELAAEPAIVLGHRGGGLVAGRLAAQHPAIVRALVLDNAPLYSAAEREARVGKFPDRQEIAPDGSHITDRWAWVREKGDPDWSDETVHISVITYFLHGPWKEHGHRAIPRYDFEQDLPRIACPVLVIASQNDPVFPYARRLSEVRKDWERATLPGGPGMVTDRSGQWWEPVARFLQSVS